MPARNGDACLPRAGREGEFPTSDERVLVLTNLIPLRNVRIEITLAIEFSKIGDGPPDRGTDAYDMSHCLAINDGERPRVRHADGTDVYVRPRLVGVVLRVAKHLRPRLQLRMNLETDGWSKFTHS